MFVHTADRRRNVGDPAGPVDKSLMCFHASYCRGRWKLFRPGDVCPANGCWYCEGGLDATRNIRFCLFDAARIVDRDAPVPAVVAPTRLDRMTMPATD